MKIQAMPASAINWIGNQGSIQKTRTGFGDSAPPVIELYGRHSSKRFVKLVDESLERGHAVYVSQCEKYTLEIV